MGTKRRKRVTPIALLWTRRDQLRFTDAVERLVAEVNDLRAIVAELQAQTAKRSRRPSSAAPIGAAQAVEAQ